MLVINEFDLSFLKNPIRQKIDDANATIKNKQEIKTKPSNTGEAFQSAINRLMANSQNQREESK
jgi:hypothetical protein